MTTTADLFDEGKRRGPSSALRLSSAYEAVFRLGKPMKEDLELVMNDLAEFSGYFTALPPDAPDAVMRDHNGKRAVFARILSLIQLPVFQLEILRNAALAEMQISSMEGER